MTNDLLVKAAKYHVIIEALHHYAGFLSDEMRDHPNANTEHRDKQIGILFQHIDHLDGIRCGSMDCEDCGYTDVKYIADTEDGFAVFNIPDIHND